MKIAVQSIEDEKDVTILQLQETIRDLTKNNINFLPTNFQLAAKRISNLRQKILKHPEHMQNMIESIDQLRKYQYIIPADSDAQGQINYLSIFPH